MKVDSYEERFERRLGVLQVFVLAEVEVRIYMTQEETWLKKYQEVMTFIETNHRNPSRHNPEERGLYLNWIKHNRKMMNTGLLKSDRVEMFKELQVLTKRYQRKNQYE